MFARFLAAVKVTVKGGYHWGLKNQTLASRGLMLAGTTVGTVVIVYGNRQGNRDIKKDIHDKHEESRHYFDKKFTELKKADMEIQRLIFSCAASTMKGFQGDTTEIENFIKGVEVFEKAIRCI